MRKVLKTRCLPLSQIFRSSLKCICLTEMEFSAKGVEVTQQDWEPPVCVVASAVVVQTRLGQDAAVQPPVHTCSTDGDVVFGCTLAVLGQDQPG